MEITLPYSTEGLSIQISQELYKALKIKKVSSIILFSALFPNLTKSNKVHKFKVDLPKK